MALEMKKQTDLDEGLGQESFSLLKLRYSETKSLGNTSLGS